MTLDGTNTWVVSTNAGNVVIDAGPDLPDHLSAVAELGPVAGVVLTHRHLDHSAGALAFHRLTGAPVRALDPQMCIEADVLPGDREVLEIGGRRFMVIHAPGHTSDSVCFAVRFAHQHVLFSGDTVLGRGSTIVAYPDGALGDYLTSLTNLRELTSGDPSGDPDSDQWQLLPGHGPARPNALEVIDEYIAHRMARLDQVRAALDAGAVTARDVVAVVYADVERSLWPAAEATVNAQLAYLGHLKD
jgi:glyoxylase-like metal-dependent hydrolase (beta-lactamase superfamily II)